MIRPARFAEYRLGRTIAAVTTLAALIEGAVLLADLDDDQTAAAPKRMASQCGFTALVSDIERLIAEVRCGPGLGS